MRTAPSECRRWAVLAATMLVAGCGKRSDSIAQGERQDVLNGVAVPSIAETKAIAQEGFVYGLPIVMNYAVMYAYAVDGNSGQFKAPFNEINNQARVFTYQDTAIVTPNSDTPYSILVHGSARRTDGAVGPGRGEVTVLLGDALRRQHIQLWLYRQPSHRKRRRRLFGRWRRLERRAPRWHQEGIPLLNAVLGSGLPHPALQRTRHAERGQGPGRLQSSALVGLPQAGLSSGSSGGQFSQDRAGT